jgi:hypothetical protein
VTDNVGHGVGCAYTSGGNAFGANIAQVKSSTISRNVGHGIYATTVGSTNTIITHNKGYGIYGASSVAAESCTIENNSDRGISTGDVRVNNCSVGYNGKDGIASTTSTVNNSTIKNNGGFGIGFTELLAGGIAGNLIQGNNVGVQITSSAYKVEGITNNSILTNAEFAVKNLGSASIVADGNFWGEPTTSELRNHTRNLTKIWDVRDDPTVGQVAIRTWNETATPGGAITVVPWSQAQRVLAGAQVTFTVVAEGAGPLTYQWKKEGAPIPGATSATLTLSNVSTNDVGTYMVDISNGAASTSASANLTAVQPPATLPFLSARLFMGITVTGEVGKTYTIEAAPSLDQTNDWTALTHITLTAPSQLWLDPESPTQPMRVYRAVLVP